MVKKSTRLTQMCRDMELDVVGLIETDLHVSVLRYTERLLELSFQ